jgi:hypothetical protein
LLAALAACGRIGYEGTVNVAERDGSMNTGDAGADDGSGRMDQQAPVPDLGSDVPADPAPDAAGEVALDAVDSLVPDAVISRDEASPHDAPGPDVASPRDGPGPMEAPPPDAGLDGPSAKTVVATGQNATPRRGGGSGGGTTDLCPDGRLLVGYEGTASTSPSQPWIQSVAGICATVTFPPPGAPAMAWTITLLPARGDTSGQRWTRTCPTGHVLVGFDGNAENWMGQLVFSCAPITLDSSGQGVVLGSVIELDDVGSPADNDFPQTDCPAGQAARGAVTRAGSLLESLALICGTLTVR